MIMSQERDISFLLRKYETKQPGEAYTSKRLKMDYGNKEWRLANKIRTCKYVCEELGLKGVDCERCIWIIKNVPLKELHRQASCETIITCICFYIKKLKTPKRRTYNYKVCKDYGVDEEIFSLVMARLCDYFQQHSYLKNYDKPCGQ